MQNHIINDWEHSWTPLPFCFPLPCPIPNDANFEIARGERAYDVTYLQVEAGNMMMRR